MVKKISFDTVQVTIKNTLRYEWRNYLVPVMEIIVAGYWHPTIPKIKSKAHNN